LYNFLQINSLIIIEFDIDAVSYKYFIDVVATDVKSHSNEIKTYQYSAKDIQRVIDHNLGLYNIFRVYIFIFVYSLIHIYFCNLHKIFKHNINKKYVNIFFYCKLISA